MIIRIKYFLFILRIQDEHLRSSDETLHDQTDSRGFSWQHRSGSRDVQFTESRNVEFQTIS